MKFKLAAKFKRKIAGEDSPSSQQTQLPSEERPSQQPHIRPQREPSKSKKPTTNDRIEYSKIEFRGGDSWVCYGCSLVEQKLFTKDNRANPQKRIPFHNSFKELLDCSSGDQGCRPCRVFRRALLLRQPSILEEERLVSEEKKRVTASLCKNPDLLIKISLEGYNEYEYAYVVIMASSRMTEYAKLEFNPKETAPITVKEWLNTCENHHDCKNLAWSRENPTRLLRIVDKTSFQLEDCHDLPFRRYVALSYCWGVSIASREEQDVIKRANTVKHNFKRRQSLPESTANLPATIRDAIAFTKSVGIDYIWIDSLCIIQDKADDWNSEAPKMHIVYSNAVFTLCASANNKATEPIFRNREAWRSKGMPCKLDNFYIVNQYRDLEECVQLSPLARRGWTLQEDILSPRKLYWFNQVLYWSCHERTFIEGDHQRNQVPAQNRPHTQDAAGMSSKFLFACRMGAKDEDKTKEWSKMVESYSRRILSFPSDKFKAISSVAIQYHSSQVSGPDDEPNLYLAGLWSRNFARELMWTVEKAADQRKDEWKELQDITPSWSWVSLPGASPLVMHNRSRAMNFEFSLDGLPGQEPDSVVRSEDIVMNGQKKFKIRITGRLRSFTANDSQCVAWERVACSTNSTKTYDATAYIGTAIHFADPNSGTIVSVEVRRPACDGQLDYVQDAQRIDLGMMAPIYCLEVCEGAALLLEKIDAVKSCYRRLGVCWKYWNGFFSQGERTEIMIQ